MRNSFPTNELFRPQTNPHTRRAHRREVWWQIVFPLLLGVALAGVALYGLVSGRFGAVANAAEVATIFLAVPFLVIGVLLFVLILLATIALGRVMHWIPTQTVRAQRVAERISDTAIRGADAMASPLLFIDSWARAIGALFRRRI